MTAPTFDDAIDTAQESNDAGYLREALAVLYIQRRRSTAASQAFCIGIGRMKRLLGVSISRVINTAKKDAQNLYFAQ